MKFRLIFFVCCFLYTLQAESRIDHSNNVLPQNFMTIHCSEFFEKDRDALLEKLFEKSSRVICEKVVVDSSDNLCVHQLEKFFGNKSKCIQKNRPTYLGDALNNQIDEGQSGECQQKKLFSRDELYDAFSYAYAQMRFSVFNCFWSTDKKGIVCLTIRVQCAWLVERITIRGVLHDRDQYRRYYTLTEGGVFDESLHVRGVQMLKDGLVQQGFFNATLTENVVYDNAHKVVFITLMISSGKKYRIGSCDIEVPNFTPMDNDLPSFIEMLRSRFCRRIVGKVYQEDDIDSLENIMRDFLIDKGFYDSSLAITKKIDHQDKKVHLSLVVSLHNQRFLEITGNSFFCERVIKKQVLPFPHAIGMIQTSVLKKEIAQLYHAHGFFDAHIEIIEKKITSCISLIQVTIIEGRRYLIGSMYGLDAEVVVLCEPLNKAYFTEQAVFNIKQQIVHAYQNKGFWNVRVNFTTVNHACSHFVDIHWQVSPDVLHVLKDIIVDNPSIDKLVPLSLYSSFVVEKPLSFMSISALQHALNVWAHEEGFFSLFYDPDVQIDDFGSVRIHFVIKGNACRYTLKECVLHGVSKTRYERLMAFVNNSSPKVLRDRMNKLGVYDMFDVAPVTRVGDTYMKRIHLHDAYRFLYGVSGGFYLSGGGFSLSDSTGKLGGDAEIKNVFGRLDSAGGSLVWTRFRREIQGFYSYPFATADPSSAESRVYSIEYDQPLSSDIKETLYKTTQDGVRVNFAWDMAHAHTDIGCGFETTVLKHISPLCASLLCYKPILIDTYIPAVFSQFSYSFSKVDFALAPRRGYSLSASLRGLCPFHSFTDAYAKALVDLSAYMPIGPCVGAVHMKMGYIFNQNFSAINLVDRFYLGGAFSIRGYQRDLVPPFIPYSDCCGCKTLVPVGGNGVWALSGELRYPLWSILEGAAFVDSGIILSECCDKKIKNFFVTTIGCGLRYMTPLGVLRFDFGWKLRRIDILEPLWAWHLTLGYAY